MRRASGPAVVGLLGVLCLGAAPLAVRGAARPRAPEPELSLSRLPLRPARAPEGLEFARRTAGFSGPERQRAALTELRRGNVPTFLRHLLPVHLSYQTPDGRELHATVWVTPDYLAVGSDRDFLRVPLSLPSALAISHELGSALPTRKIVDAIYDQATLRLTPQPLPPGPAMRSTGYCLLHQEEIEAQRAGFPLGELVAGHKKDLVLSGRLRSHPGRVAIYGWHRASGDPIQPLSTVHGARYADYSHGVRLVSESVLVEDRLLSYYDVLGDPELGPLLTYEGVIDHGRELMNP